MSKNSQTYKQDNYFTDYWKNGLESFWNSYQQDTSIEGFPCFCCLICKSVSKGEIGEEDPSHLPDNIVYIYPRNIPEKIKISFVGGLISFSTYSIVNLNCIPSSFSWNKSEIAIHSYRFENGDYLLFALKLPKFFTARGTSCALERTLRALSYNIPFDANRPNISYSSDSIILKESEKIKTSDFLEDNIEIIFHCAFPPENKLNNPFFYISQNIFPFEENPPLAIATQLDHFCIKKSSYVAGTATLFDDKFIVSSIPHNLSFLFPFYKEAAKKLSNHKDLKFDTFQLRVPFIDMNNGINDFILKDEQKNSNTQDKDLENDNKNNIDDQTPILMNLCVMTCKELSFFVLIKEHKDKNTVLSHICDLLMNGIYDFSLECRRYSTKDQQKDKITDIIAYWPHSGILKMSPCKPETFTQISEIHNEMAKNEKLLEFLSNNGETQISGLNLISFEVFTEVEFKGNLRTAVEETYAKIKQFLPNLPDDLQEL